MGKIGMVATPILSSKPTNSSSVAFKSLYTFKMTSTHVNALSLAVYNKFLAKIVKSMKFTRSRLPLKRDPAYSMGQGIGNMVSSICRGGVAQWLKRWMSSWRSGFDPPSGLNFSPPSLHIQMNYLYNRMGCQCVNDDTLTSDVAL